MFQNMSCILYKHNFIKSTFQKAIIEREREFPTGLQTEVVNFAIPHTDVEHIQKPFISIVRPKNNIRFIQMGTTDMEIDVGIIFILGIKDSSEQVGMLSLIMEKIQNISFKKEINQSKSKEEFENIVRKYLGGVNYEYK